MPRALEPGVPALFKYNQLRYSFVDIGAGDQLVLTSDPWSFLNSHLQTTCKGLRGGNKVRAERALYFASLAEDFYRAAETTPLPARATLYYYGMLDLAKCLLSTRGIELETVVEHHGVSLVTGSAQTVEVKPLGRDSANIFAEFTRVLGGTIGSRKQVDLKTSLSHIPEIHGIFNVIENVTKSNLLPVDIDFKVNNTHQMLFTEISYDKRQESKIDASRFLKGKRQSYFRDGCPQPGRVVYRAARRKAFTQENMDRIYRNILGEYRDFDIVPILTPSGYRYYVDLRPGQFPHLANVLLSMFYLGSAARYRPVEIEDLLNGEMRPLISEFVAISPRQFLYQVVSIVAGKECVVPFASI